MMNQLSSLRRDAWLVPGRVAVALMLLVTLLHLLVAGRAPLSVDEAHYALYGLYLDWSYFDHPPLVGWLQALILPLSESEFALRLWPIALNLLNAWLLYRLTAALYPERPWHPPLVVLLFQSMLVVVLLGLALVPDWPLLTAALLSAHALLRLGRSEGGSAGDWLLLGAALGLAGLAKYTAITLVPGVFIYLLWQGRLNQLKTPWPWLALLLALLMITPVLYWNASHDWISFAYQLGHGAPDVPWSLSRFASAQAMQLAGYSPALYLFGWLALLVALRQPSSEAARLSLALVLPGLLLFGWSAGYDMGLPHWTLLSWVLVLPLTLDWLSGQWHRRWLRVLVWLNLLWSVVLLLLVHLLLFGSGIAFKPYAHPLADLLGWQAVAERAAELYEQRFDEAEPGSSAIYVGNWVLGSRITWYARPLPVRVADARFDQFDLWAGGARPSANGILLVPDYLDQRPAENGRERFAFCEPIDNLQVDEAGVVVHSFTFYACYGYLGDDDAG